MINFSQIVKIYKIVTLKLCTFNNAFMQYIHKTQKIN